MRKAAGLSEVEINKEFEYKSQKTNKEKDIKEKVSMYQHDTNVFIFQGNTQFGRDSFID